MRRVAAVLLLAVFGCAKGEPSAERAATGASAAALPTTAPVDTTRANPPAVATRDTVQGQQTAIQTGHAGMVLVGEVGEHGFDPATFLAITPAGGAQTRVSGPQIEALRGAKGAQVWARGEKVGDAFRVDTFEVRRANDQAVADGVVSVAGTTVTVRTSSGRLTYPDAPTDLRAAAGARVWITLPIRGQAPSFGVISTSRNQ